MSQSEEYILIRKCDPVGDAFQREISPSRMKAAHNDYDDPYNKVISAKFYSR